MSEERMGDDQIPDQGPSDRGDGFELDSEVDENLEEAIQEALDAVEAAVKPGKPEEAEEAEEAEERLLDSEERSIELADEEGSANEAVRLRQQTAELRERSIRTLADFENYRKRVERERAQQDRYDGFEVLRQLLDVIDNLERAVQADGKLEDLKSGVQMILRQVEDVMRRHGVERVKADGELFDPAVHEAVLRLETSGAGEPSVQEVHQSGYLMGDRLLRPAKVTVAVPEMAPQEADDPSGEDAGRE
ncbi:MAG: nucleotide exchange factor GrpE [Acidobacteriota bacterium]|nr:nucleotide exchange factor GrpE [Acidobacteriota bacterium]